MFKICIFFLLVIATAYASEFENVPLMAPFTTENNQVVLETLVLNNPYGDTGEWGPVQLCPENNYIRSASVMWHVPDNTDETAVNGIKLFCQDFNDQITGYVTSTVGTKGVYQPILSCFEGVLTGIRVMVLEHQGGLIDDVAVSNFQMSCAYGNETVEAHIPEDGIPVGQDFSHDDSDVSFEEVQSRAYRVGTWSDWQQCSDGLEVCGLQTRYEETSLVGDQVAISDVLFFCCEVPLVEV